MSIIDSIRYRNTPYLKIGGKKTIDQIVDRFYYIMDTAIFIAIVGAFINLILSSTVPILTKDVKLSLIEEIKQVYKTHGNLILASTIIVFVTIYLSLRFTPYINTKLSEITGLNLISSENQVANLANLARL